MNDKAKKDGKTTRSIKTAIDQLMDSVLGSAPVIMALALGFGLVVWVTDAFLDDNVTHEGYGTFLDVLVTRPPYLLLISLACFAVFGVLVALNHSKRERAEKALRESEERYRTLTEAAQDAIFIIDREDNIVFVNSFGAGLFGQTPMDVIGKSRSKMFPPEVTGGQYQSLQQVFKSDEPSQEDAKTVFRKHEVWLSTRLVPLKNDTGEIYAVLGVSREITERKQAEVAVRKVHDTMERKRRSE